jgi:hypothetical protein
VGFLPTGENATFNLRKQEKQRADYQQQRADRLAALLRERGVDPNELL